MRLFSIFVCVFSLSLLSLPKWSDACTCPRISLAKANKRAQAIFTARVLSVVIDKRASRIKYVMQVQRYWKGKLTRKLKLQEVWGPCANYMAKGKRYLIFAKHRKGIKGLSTMMCTGTRPIAQARKWRKKLGKGKRPKK